MQITVRKVLIYLWIVSISLGMVYNLFGSLPFFICMGLIALMDFKIGKNKKVLLGLGAFGIYFLTKVMWIENYIPVSDYHSVILVVRNMIQICIGLLLLAVIKKEKLWDNKTKTLFHMCYYTSILISIAIILVEGRDIYRSYAWVGGNWLAPQFYLFYAMGFSLLYTFLLLKTKQNRFKYLVLLMMNVIYIVLANYTIQMLVTFFGMGMLVLLHWVKSIGIFMITIVFAVSMPFVFTEASVKVIEVVNEHLFANNLTVYMRMEELANIFGGNSKNATDWNVRKELKEISRESFKQNYIWGIDFNEYNKKGKQLNVGGHMQWDDDLARWGIIGMALWIFVLWQGTKEVLILKKPYSQFEIIYILLYILYGFLNPFISLQYIYITFIIMRIEQDELKESILILREMERTDNVVYNNRVGI